MNKRAATRNALAPLWQIGDRHSIFAGPLQYNAPHSHSVPVLIAGLHGKFAIRFRNSDWHTVEAALVRAGTAYELDVAGYPVCVLYLEPTTSGFDALTPLLAEAAEHEGALTGRCRDIARWRSFYEDPESMTWAQTALDDLIAYRSRAIGEQSRDARIAHALQHLQDTAEDATTSACAARINLSASRFQSSLRRSACPFADTGPGAGCAWQSAMLSRARALRTPRTVRALPTKHIFRGCFGKPSAPHPH